MTDEPDLESAYALKTPDDNRRLYSAWADTYDRDFVAATTYRFPYVVTRDYIDGGGAWPCLDVGCGTGALGERLPRDAVIDGIDLSPEMLAVARRKGRYRTLIEANLKEPLALPDAAYAGLVSAGTFTHGHVGPEALAELVRILRPGALAVITSRPDIWDELGFAPVFAALVDAAQISKPHIREEAIYSDPTRAPEGHGDDIGLIVRFTRL